MSAGYVAGPSRGAWENANFWQRMNPKAMTVGLAVGERDCALAQVEATHKACPSCHKWIRPRGFERHLRACSPRHWRNRGIPF